MDADQALKKLMDGNQRYITARVVHPHQDTRRRRQVAKGQSPIAVVVGCSDSRVPPEIVFDQGLGDLFVIRTAGNVVDNVSMASIEYAVEHVHVPLVMVLGHRRCGAVDAALHAGEVHGHIKSLVKAIAPSIDKLQGKSGDLLDMAVKANIKRVVAKIKSSKPILSHLVKKGRVKVVGAYYNLDSG
mgnify:FL=1